ncbi:alpha/beta fold hydrolase [Desertimonas flava]|jgi:pimeloyl-ACP methyl ester carboxylesterase|uniref:alpha/beta fold hydrolase n=1 Tax=Desertimonas flava TaxID=2064846 RepID=UPI000E34F302|nr:alpha/beta hydrolase [Desertimonas flava]
MTAADVNGIRIEYEIYGDGEPLLLEMGLAGQMISWPLDWVNLLVDAGFRVIRFDNRDIGLSTTFDAAGPVGIPRLARAIVRRHRTSDAPYRISDMADDAAGLLDHLGIERAHLVGVSMGGMISQAVAIQYPGKVASLTSIMSNTGDRRHGVPAPALLRQFRRLRPTGPEGYVEGTVQVFRLISGPHFDEAEIRAMAQEALDRHFDSDGTSRQLLAILASPDRTADLRRVTAPTLVVHGLVDPLVRPSGGIATARAIPGSRLLMFPDMGHDLPRPRWEEIIEAIVDNAVRGGFTRKAAVTV